MDLDGTAELTRLDHVEHQLHLCAALGDTALCDLALARAFAATRARRAPPVPAVRPHPVRATWRRPPRVIRYDERKRA